MPACYSLRMVIAQIRKAQGLTQEQLAEMAGIEVVTLSRAENAFPGTTLRTLTAISKALDVPLPEITAKDVNDPRYRMVKAFASIPDDQQNYWLEMVEKLAQASGGEAA